jgi:hypothetical protein
MVHWFFGGASGYEVFPLLWGVPLIISCILADLGAAAVMAGIEKITKAGEKVITKARINWRNLH